MDDKRPNLLDPDFEPTDEQLREIERDFIKLVRERAAAVQGEAETGALGQGTASTSKQPASAK